MRRIVRKYKAQYMGTGSRSMKRVIVLKAHDEIVEGGIKFLKQVGGDEWVEVDAEAAIEKVAHSLRCRKVHKVDIQEPSANRLVGSINQKIINVKPRLTMPQGILAHQGIIKQHQLSSTVSTQRLEGEVLRQIIAQRQAADSDELLVRSMLVHQLRAERFRTNALMQSLPFMQPAIASVPELQTLRAIEHRQKLRWIMESPGYMFPRFDQPKEGK